MELFCTTDLLTCARTDTAALSLWAMTASVAAIAVVLALLARQIRSRAGLGLGVVAAVTGLASCVLGLAAGVGVALGPRAIDPIATVSTPSAPSGDAATAFVSRGYPSAPPSVSQPAAEHGSPKSAATRDGSGRYIDLPKALLEQERREAPPPTRT